MTRTWGNAARAASVLGAGLVFAQALVASIAAEPEANTVRVETGALQGSADAGVAAFKNIPYAAPPVGDRRWRAPAPAQAWEGLRDATKYGTDCLQNRMSWDKAMSAQPTGEDCLYLNVWTPSPRAGNKLPVMVWIHGGGFTSGSGTSPMMAGDKLAARGVVVVTFNYRLGRFGFFAHPALSAETPDGPVGNYGLMDQVAALQWVQRNIGAFGGDPANVTIFGESAGGDAVYNLMLSEAARGLFAKAISQSGGGRTPWPARPSAEALGQAFAEKVGIKGNDLAALRALPAKKVLGDISLLNNEKKTYSGPMIDGRLVTVEVAEGFAAGRQAKVPFIIGANGNELGGLPGFLLKPITKELLPRLGGDLDKVVAAYGSRDAFDASFASDFNFVEPARFLAASAAAAGQPTYLYRFNYVAESKRSDLKGAAHATDVAYLFDHLETNGEKISDADRVAAKLIGDYWVAFAKSGEPKVEGHAAWPTYSAKDDRLLEFTTAGTTVAEAATPGLVAITSHFAQPAALVVAASAPDAAAIAPAAASPADTACTKLMEMTLEHGKVDSAGPMAPPEVVEIGIPGLPPLPVSAAFCRVQATLKPTTASEIHVEAWLPPREKWNGRFLGAGNAGFAGDFSSPYLFMLGTVARGYAAAGTDTGHKGLGMGKGEVAGAGWAAGNPEKLKDYGHRAEHLTAQFGKTVVRAYYGEAPKYSYFQGCSNGGREALMEAQRYPDDYDGIIAGAPANYFSRDAAGFAWNSLALRESPGSALTSDKLSVLTDAVIKQCDALDGVTDGLLEDPRKCKFDPASVQCKAGQSDGCLSAEQVKAVRKIYQGPVDARNKKRIFPGFPPGAEAVQWDDWITGVEATQTFFATEYFRHMVFEKPDWQLSQLDFGPDVAKALAKTSSIIDSDNPDLSGFVKSGGKLIVYHGWADGGLSPLGSIQYYEDVRRKMGAGTDKFMRLYMVPGMAHCLGGPGPSHFNMLGELEQWVEQGKAPAAVTASKYANDLAGLLGLPMGDPLRTRPLCPYPKTARYKGAGSIDQAENFECK